MEIIKTCEEKVVLSHPTGNANSRAAAVGFANANILSRFYTSIATFEGDFLDKISGWGPLSELRRRRFDVALKPFTHTSPFREAGRILSAKAGINGLCFHERGIFSIDAIYRSIDRQVASSIKDAKKSGVVSIYAYEDGALCSFRQAKSLGMQCLYDLPIGYWRTAKRLLEDEAACWPEWTATLKGLEDSELKLAAKDEEIRLADRIFVASSFTAETLKDFPGALAPIEIIPYGFPAVIHRRDYSAGAKSKLKLLFVGGLSQRKGIAQLFAAADALKDHVELTLVGMKPTENCAALNAALGKHCWIPSLKHEMILKLMGEHDVLVFPSLFEGFGLVITEAMSQGTPVITTERTCGPDLIEHDVNGWLIEAGSATALQAAIEKLIRDRSLIADAGYQAMQTAKKRPWEIYGSELANTIKKFDSR